MYVAADLSVVAARMVNEAAVVVAVMLMGCAVLVPMSVNML